MEMPVYAAMASTESAGTVCPVLSDRPGTEPPVSNQDSSQLAVRPTNSGFSMGVSAYQGSILWRVGVAVAAVRAESDIGMIYLRNL